MKGTCKNSHPSSSPSILEETEPLYVAIGPFQQLPTANKDTGFSDKH